HAGELEAGRHREDAREYQLAQNSGDRAPKGFRRACAHAGSILTSNGRRARGDDNPRSCSDTAVNQVNEGARNIAAAAAGAAQRLAERIVAIEKRLALPFRDDRRIVEFMAPKGGAGET